MVAHPDGSREGAGSNLVVPTKLRPLKYQGSFLFKIVNRCVTQPRCSDSALLPIRYFHQCTFVGQCLEGEELAPEGLPVYSQDASLGQQQDSGGVA
jgi:hypothetical protein